MLGAKIADALDAIHRQNVVHLDLKPSNIVFRETGEAVLIDYGLACHIHMPDLMGEEFRLPYGTAPYMAPEQVIGRRIRYTVVPGFVFGLGRWVAPPLREAHELLPRYRGDNVFDSSKFTARFPDFAVTDYLDGIGQVLRG